VTPERLVREMTPQELRAYERRCAEFWLAIPWPNAKSTDYHVITFQMGKAFYQCARRRRMDAERALVEREGR
jgi:hypothetical protein